MEDAEGRTPAPLQPPAPPESSSVDVGALRRRSVRYSAYTGWGWSPFRAWSVLVCGGLDSPPPQREPESRPVLDIMEPKSDLVVTSDVPSAQSRTAWASQPTRRRRRMLARGGGGQSENGMASGSRRHHWLLARTTEPVMTAAAGAQGEGVPGWSLAGDTPPDTPAIDLRLCLVLWRVSTSQEPELAKISPQTGSTSGPSLHTCPAQGSIGTEL